MSRSVARWLLTIAFVGLLGWSFYLGRSGDDSVAPRMGAAPVPTELAPPAAASSTELGKKLEALGLEAQRMQSIEAHVHPALREFEKAAADARKMHGEGVNPDLVAAMDRLAARLQAELGPVDYDWVLYAYERDNRVVVKSTPAEEPEATGLLAGDVLFSYAGQRVFTREDLRRAYSQIVPGSRVAARVARANVWVDLELPDRPLGALGFALEARRERPEPPQADFKLAGYGS